MSHENHNNWRMLIGVLCLSIAALGAFSEYILEVEPGT